MVLICTNGTGARRYQPSPHVEFRQHLRVRRNTQPRPLGQHHAALGVHRKGGAEILA